MRHLLVFLLKLLEFVIRHPVLTIFLQANIALDVFRHDVPACFRLSLIFFVVDLIILFYCGSRLTYWQDDVSRQLRSINRKLDEQQNSTYSK